jgi:hypothetical protein
MPPNVDVKKAISLRWAELIRWTRSVPPSTRLDIIFNAADGPSRVDFNCAISLRTNQPGGGVASAGRSFGGRRGDRGRAGRGRGGRGGHAATSAP